MAWRSPKTGLGRCLNMTIPEKKVVQAEAPTKTEVESSEAKAPAVDGVDVDETSPPFKRATPAAVTAHPPARRPIGVERRPIW